MSSFTNYETKAAEDYDITRIPIGTEIIEGAIRKYSPSKGGWEDSQLLDLGCGTGSYAKILLDRGLGHCTLADAADKMLKQSSQKIFDYLN